MAVGGDVAWQASAPDPALDLSDYEGTLPAGGSATVTVTVRAGSLAGAGSVTISAGGQQVAVPVTWAALPGLGLSCLASIRAGSPEVCSRRQRGRGSHPCMLADSRHPDLA